MAQKKLEIIKILVTAITRILEMMNQEASSTLTKCIISFLIIGSKKYLGKIKISSGKEVYLE